MDAHIYKLKPLRILQWLGLYVRSNAVCLQLAGAKCRYVESAVADSTAHNRWCHQLCRRRVAVSLTVTVNRLSSPPSRGCSWYQCKFFDEYRCLHTSASVCNVVRPMKCGSFFPHCFLRLLKCSKVVLTSMNMGCTRGEGAAAPFCVCSCPCPLPRFPLRSKF